LNLQIIIRLLESSFTILPKLFIADLGMVLMADLHPRGCA